MSKMLAEINEQPTALERTLAAEKGKYESIGRVLRERDIDLVVLVGRGSSDNAALFGRYLIETRAGIPVSLCAPSVYTLYNAKLRLDRALVVGVSQSGEGDDINLVLESAKAARAFTLAVTNEAGSTMANLVDEAMLIHAGRERSVAATKTYTGQILHFYMLANELADERIKLDGIPDLAAASLSTLDQVRELVERYIFMENCVVVGRGMNYGNSYELALKLMETCYVVAERFSSADFFHGPLAIIERRFPAITFAPIGATLRSSLELLQRLRELKADCMSITNSREAAALSTRSLMVPGEIEEILTPIPFIIPAQLFAALLSDSKGLDPDAPRSISKVTKTI